MKPCDHALERDLTERLLALNFHAFLRTVALLLEAMGYEKVKLSGRTGWVGRNADGGYDLVADFPVPGGTRRVIVQAKQYAGDRKIYRRSVDELRGVCLRAGASESLLITTSSFSAALDSRSLSSTLLAPVRLIDGHLLADLCAQYRIGVWEEPPASQTESARRGLDERFFTGLEAQYSGIGRPADADKLSFAFTITVSPRRRANVEETKKAALPHRS